MCAKKTSNSELFKMNLDEKPDPDKSEVGGERETGRRDTLSSRSNSLGQIASGDIINKTLKQVDPAQCRMWEHHNRAYDLLSEKRCADLIEGIKAQGKQEFPAIVRAITTDPDYDYEVICGARRHWSITWLRNNNYSDYKFLVEVRDLNDEQAFRLSDIENRDREDISDYERALDYKNALSLYYRTQSEMAKRLETSEAWLSRYLDLASLPEEIVNAYGSITDIRAGHMRELKPLLKDARKRAVMIKTAVGLAKQHGEEGVSIDGAEVVKLLKTGLTPKSPKASTKKIEVYRCSSSDRPMMEVSMERSGGLLFRLKPKAGANKVELLAAFGDALEKHFEG